MQADPHSGLPPAYTVFLARHATPDRSRYDLPYHLPPGPPLTERGCVEAAELGHFLRGMGVQHCFASPLERTLTTAQIAAGIAQAGVEVLPEIAEMRPEETMPMVLERAQRGFLLAAQHSHKLGHPVVMVSHGSPVLALVRWLGLPEAQIDRSRIYDSRNLIPPAGAWRVEWDGVLRKVRLVFVPAGVRIPEFVEIVG